MSLQQTAAAHWAVRRNLGRTQQFLISNDCLSGLKLTRNIAIRNGIYWNSNRLFHSNVKHLKDASEDSMKPVKWNFYDDNLWDESVSDDNYTTSNNNNDIKDIGDKDKGQMNKTLLIDAPKSKDDLLLSNENDIMIDTTPIERWYRFNFDSYKLVRGLESHGFTRDQAVSVMRVVNAVLIYQTNKTKNMVLSKVEQENQIYLFKAHLQELRNELQMVRQHHTSQLKSEIDIVMRKIDSLQSKLTEHLSILKAEITMDVNNHKTNGKEMETETNLHIQEVYHRLIVKTSDLRVKIEKVKVEATSVIVWATILTFGTLMAAEFFLPNLWKSRQQKKEIAAAAAAAAVAASNHTSSSIIGSNNHNGMISKSNQDSNDNDNNNGNGNGGNGNGNGNGGNGNGMINNNVSDINNNESDNNNKNISQPLSSSSKNSLLNSSNISSTNISNTSNSIPISNNNNNNNNHGNHGNNLSSSNSIPIISNNSIPLSSQSSNSQSNSTNNTSNLNPSSSLSNTQLPSSSTTTSSIAPNHKFDDSSNIKILIDTAPSDDPYANNIIHDDEHLKLNRINNNNNTTNTHSSSSLPPPINPINNNNNNNININKNQGWFAKLFFKNNINNNNNMDKDINNQPLIPISSNYNNYNYTNKDNNIDNNNDDNLNNILNKDYNTNITNNLSNKPSIRTYEMSNSNNNISTPSSSSSNITTNTPLRSIIRDPSPIRNTLLTPVNPNPNNNNNNLLSPTNTNIITPITKVAVAALSNSNSINHNNNNNNNNNNNM